MNRARTIATGMVLWMGVLVPFSSATARDQAVGGGVVAVPRIQQERPVQAPPAYSPQYNRGDNRRRQESSRRETVPAGAGAERTPPKEPEETPE